MHRIFISLIVSLFAQCIFAQDDFTVEGLVKDRLTDRHLTNARVQIIDSSDSIIGSDNAWKWEQDPHTYVSTSQARFSVKIPKLEGEYTLKIKCEGYDSLMTKIELTQLGKRELMRDLGVFYLTKTKQLELNEVEVVATKIKFYHRGDTLVYNADAFQLAEGSMLDELIRQLPGVTLERGGVIKVNGKKIAALLLNGKAFFHDNKIMLENLGAYTVKTVEVYNQQSEMARFLGDESEENKSLVMDVKLKKEYLGGWTVNTDMGGGTKERYLARLFALNYNSNSQFTLFNNTNNLNVWQQPSQFADWDNNQSSGSGVRNFSQTGFNYSIQNKDGKFRATGSTTVDYEKTTDETETNSVNYLQTLTTSSHSKSTSRNRSFKMRTNHSLRKEFKAVMLSLTPELSYYHGNNDSESDYLSWNPEAREEFINKSLSMAYGRSNNLNASLQTSAAVKIPGTSDAISLSASVSHQGSENQSRSRTLLFYGNGNMPPSARNQMTDGSPNYTNTLTLSSGYTLKLNSKLSTSLSYDFYTHRSKSSSAFYLGQLVAEHSGDYTLENLAKVERAFDPENSNEGEDGRLQHTLKASISWRPNMASSFSVSLPFVFKEIELDYHQNGKDYHAERSRTGFDGVSASANVSNGFEKKVRVNGNVGYSFYYQMPSLMSLIDVQDTRDPLNRYVCNPDLKDTRQHHMHAYFSLNTGHWNFSSNASYSFTQDAAISGYTYDTNTGMRINKMYNVDGTYNASLSGNIDYSFTKFRVSSNFQYSRYKSIGMIGENALTPRKYGMYSNSYTPSLTLQGNFSQKAQLELTCHMTWMEKQGGSSLVNANDLSYSMLNCSLRGNFKLPHNWSLNTTLALNSRDGLQDDRMNTTEWIWNLRVTKAMMKSKLLASVTAFDLLQQIQGVHYYISPQARVETFSNTIPRYVLFHLQYRLNIKPKR